MNLTVRSLALLLLALPLAGCKKAGEPKTAATAVAKSTRGNDAADLKIKWPPGARYTQRMEVATTSETFVPKTPNPVKQDLALNQEFSITVLKERDGGGRELE